MDIEIKVPNNIFCRDRFFKAARFIYDNMISYEDSGLFGEPQTKYKFNIPIDPYGNKIPKTDIYYKYRITKGGKHIFEIWN